jgi:hypothetical protein
MYTSTTTPADQKDAEFIWDERCETSFQRIKIDLISSGVLVHYDSNLTPVLVTTASPYGLGVILLHVMPDCLVRQMDQE